MKHKTGSKVDIVLNRGAYSTSLYLCSTHTNKEKNTLKKCIEGFLKIPNVLKYYGIRDEQIKNIKAYYSK